MKSWLRSLFARSSHRHTHSRTVRNRPRNPLRAFEALEDRVLPSFGWSTLPALPRSPTGALVATQPSHALPLLVNSDEMRSILSAAPTEAAVAAGAQPLVMTLPMPDGQEERFAVVYSSILSPELAAQFPMLSTYRGQGLDDPLATLSMDLTPAGFHAQILSPSGAVYIDPYYIGENQVHISYYKSDLGPPEEFCEDGEDGAAVSDPGAASRGPNLAGGSLGDPSWGGLRSRPASGTQLRTHRQAVAADGQHTTF